MATIQAKTYTPSDLLAMPDSNGIELVNGELVEKPVSVLSCIVEARLLVRLGAHCDAHNLGEVLGSSNGIQCYADDPRKVRKPDLSFVKRARLSLDVWEEGFMSIAPNLAVEVMSPNDEATELHEKVEEYLAAGVELVWVVDPLNGIIVIHRHDGSVAKLHRQDELSGEDVIPGFRCKVTELFPDVSGTARGERK